MNERDFEIGSRKFKLNKIDAFKQFHIVRRIAPILSDLLPVAQKFQKMSDAELSNDQVAALAPILNGLSKLSDDDSNRVLMGLLSSVEMQQTAAGGWARLASNDMLMFQDLELPVLLQCAGRAFMFNMQGFFGVLPQVSQGGK